MLNLPHTESIVTFVTAQLQVVRKAILEGSANVVLGRTNIGINPNCCFLLSQ